MESIRVKPLSGEKTVPIAEGWVLVIGMILIAANLRAPLTSVGPLVGTIRSALGISNTIAGMITTLPLLAFALLSPLAPRLARRFGAPAVLFFAMMLLAAGIALRSAAGEGALLTGTVILGMAIAVCNVLMPSLIKEKFPHKIGVMIGVYSVAMNLCGAIASGISVPLAKQLEQLGLGWNGALGVWAFPAVLAVLCWIPQIRGGHKRQSAALSASASAQAAAGPGRTNLWRSALAWQVALFMGLQSLVFYVIVAWLPGILQSYGMTLSAAGWTLSMMQLALLPISFLVPIWAGRMKSQVPLVLLTAAVLLIGVGGLLLGYRSIVVVSAILVGVGAGCSFSLAMMFFGLRTRTAQGAAELSGMSQSVGYLLAAVGPTLFGYLHDATQGWTVPLVVLLAVGVLLLVFGLGSARNRYVEG
ncbi:putative transporter YycB [Paenibacillus solanacearum]|uniref:Transporter YycB n=1 Tax=Paenibacillus solanacearum TaxID=2048548 RepID=A0A916NKG8_9BACL|nr:MFS transporter [Paenibacillus solanacearum]CAG7645128.1 putative transporter YycB [Paenibacillus solanacearum]